MSNGMEDRVADILALREKSALPELYSAAKVALEKCVEVDECAEWANKAKALEVYALQSKDETLFRLAVRIRARAIQRFGQLMMQVESKPGARTDLMSVQTRGSVATEHGLSLKELATALRVANVPEEKFEELVESQAPPSITELAALGTKKRPTKKEIKRFQVSTEGQAAIGVLYRTAMKLDPRDVVKGATMKERQRIRTQAVTCSSWLRRVIKQSRKEVK